MFISNNSDSVVIVIHEIYGINQHILEACEQFKKAGFDVICPDLLNVSKPYDYANEKVAYEYFIKNVGFDLAAEKIRKVIAEARVRYKKVFLAGFSIGATIAWLCSDENPACDGIIGYYGSRIRNCLNIIPKCPTLLIFAEEEKSFNVAQMINVLKKKTNVEAYVLPGKHGFSDCFSSKYNEQSEKKAAELVYDFFRRKL